MPQPIRTLKFPILKNEIQLSRPIQTGIFCEAVGNKSAALGYEQGVFEIWVYPFKILHDLQLSFFIEKYNQTVNGADIAKQVVVRPELTTIIYSHDLFTLQQHLLAPIHEPGVIMFLDIKTYCPVTLTVSFSPDLVPMWPAGLGGQYTLWQDSLNAYYIGEGSRKIAAIIGSPLSKQQSNTPGHQLPEEAMQMAFEITPETAEVQYFPVIFSASVQGKEDAITTYQNLLNNIPQLYSTNLLHYQRLQKDFLSIQSPESDLNLALEWAKVSLDKGFADNPYLGRGLTAGYGVAGNTQRPGFAWFFGGDVFLNAYAISGYGDFGTIKQSLTFFCNNQRQDGKIPHECTQSAALINWFEDYPYAFYHADTTPYFIVAVFNYVITSGDQSFVKYNWEVIKKAYRYCLSTDTDGDGLMENSAAGLASMEVGDMLSNIKVDVYLAGVWIKALQCMEEFAQIMGDVKIQTQSKEMLEKAIASFKQIFISQDTKSINFAILEDGTILSESTVWQSIPFFFNIANYDEAQTTLKDFASSAMSTDWGVRGVSNRSKHYDPISYNTGSVWPFTTGYIAVAEYLYHRKINGYAHLLQNARLTHVDALAWHPELLSGEFYKPLSTSVPHQLFSATGIINPLLKGLLGLSGNELKKEITFAPHLPLSWEHLKIEKYRIGKDIFDFIIEKKKTSFNIRVDHYGDSANFNLTLSPAVGIDPIIKKIIVNGEKVKYSLLPSRYDTLCRFSSRIFKTTIIEIDYVPGIELEIPETIPQAGDCTTALKLIDYYLEDEIFKVIVEGLSGRSYRFKIRTRFEIKTINDGKIAADLGWDKEIEVDFEGGERENYLRKTIIMGVIP